MDARFLKINIVWKSVCVCVRACACVRACLCVDVGVFEPS